MLSKKVGVAALVAAAMMAIAACGAGNNSGSSASPGSSGSSANSGRLKCDRNLSVDETVNFPVPKAKKPYDISLLLISLAGYYYQAQAYGAQQAAKEAGVNLHVVAAKGFATAPQQLTQAQNILAKGTDAIVLGPVDYNASAPIVSTAKAQGVPVSVMGTLVHTNDTFQVVQDDYAQGQSAADALAAKLPNGGEGIVMGGPANATWSSDRVSGFKAQLAAKYPKIKIAAVTHENVDPAQGLTEFNNAASAHPKVDWIYAAYNLLLPPASVPKQYKSTTYIGGALEPTTIPQVKAGTATVIPDWPVSMGRIGVAQAVTKLNGGQPPKLTCVPSPVVSQSDLASDLGKVQQIPAGYKASS